jgi:hypothetical protein
MSTTPNEENRIVMYERSFLVGIGGVCGHELDCVFMLRLAYFYLEY